MQRPIEEDTRVIEWFAWFPYHVELNVVIFETILIEQRKGADGKWHTYAKRRKKKPPSVS